ncbi:hypothetical protein RRF57_011539 [Xylaria bambusicola]|uniref:Uncharacterized protein n=1 Tax=Xylaria bambusicola TaxID=326684 RepID=A0AAN7ZA42_9PEZI
MHQVLSNPNVLAASARNSDQDVVPIPLDDLDIADGVSEFSAVQSDQSCAEYGCRNTTDPSIDASSVSELLRKSSNLRTLLQSQGSSNTSEKDPEQYHSVPGKVPHYHDTPRKTLHVLFTWRWEIVNLSIAIGLLGAMYGILRRYEDQRVPNWGPNINLNTLLAILATALRIFLIFVVVEIIGQAKWNYFASNAQSTRDNPTRRLIKVDHFDQASRGFVGAVRLIPSIITDTTTLSAILVLLFSSGIGTFTQQAIQTRICQFPLKGISSSLPVLQNITPPSNIIPDDTLQAAMISALAPESEEIGSPVSADCPTGNCTFTNSMGGVYSTLGFCSYCADTTSLISSISWTGLYSESYTKYSLPNRMEITARIGVYDDISQYSSQLLVGSGSKLLGNWNVFELEMITSSQWSIANITILATSPRGSGNAYHEEPVAVTCTIYPCLRSYNASVVNGKLRESPAGTIPLAPNIVTAFPPNATIQDVYREIDTIRIDELFYKALATGPGLYYQAVQSPCLVGDTIWTTANMSSVAGGQRILLLHATPNETRPFTVEFNTVPIECLYAIDNAMYQYLSYFMGGNVFNDTCDTGWNSLQEEPKPTKIDCHGSFWLAKLYSGVDTTATSIMNRMEAFTDRLSNKLRMGVLGEPDFVYGQALETTVCTAVYNKWLLFPTILVAATSVLLAWSVLRSWRYQDHGMLWKSSILPFLFYSDRFELQNCEDTGGDTTVSCCTEEERLLTLSEMELEARHRMVQFCGTVRQEVA